MCYGLTMRAAPPQWRAGTLLGGTGFTELAVILQLGDRLAMDGSKFPNSLRHKHCSRTAATSKGRLQSRSGRSRGPIVGNLEPPRSHFSDTEVSGWLLLWDGCLGPGLLFVFSVL